MRRTLFVSLALLAGCGLLLSVACGGAGAVRGGSEPVATGNAVVQGTVRGSTLGLQVAVVGTPLTAPVDDEGQFALSNVPPGSATLRFEGGGVDARVTVSGLVDGQVTSLDVTVSGGSAQVTGTPTCTPTAETFFSGTIDSISGTQLVVSGRRVDASQNQKVWRGERRIQLSELQAGEKVKVWGVLRGDGVVVSEEIAALTGGGGSGETWFSVDGKIDAVASGGTNALDVHGSPNAAYYPTLVIAGRTIQTGEGTKFKWSSGAALDPREIKAGQTAHAEGWKKTDGSLRATGVTVEGTGGSSSPTWVTFKGAVEGVQFDAIAAADVHGNPNAGYPTLKVAGRSAKTDGSTAFKWSDGSALDCKLIVAGDQAYVEGWSKPEGYVLATKVVVDKR
jgi:hypothetical protein